MKYINLLCNNFELNCLFPDALLLESNTYLNKKCNFLKIQSGENLIEINHFIENLFEKLTDLNNIFEINSYYTNPIENLTIVCDRILWYRFYFPLLKNHKELFNKLENLYVERNVQIFFNFAILEAVNYEDEEEYFLYDFKFKHIKISDYELFEGKNNFHYDSFYCLYHLLAEGQMDRVLYPNIKYGYSEYHIDFKKIFTNFNINNRLNRNKIYSHTCLKPRYHRIKFLLEANRCNILGEGENNVNIQFIEEYKQAISENYLYTDNTQKHSKNHLKYFNKDLYEKFLSIKNNINITPNDADFLYDHLRNYFNKEEYNNSYIDVTGETHCIFDLKYGFFTEKSIKPILAEKFVMIYGSNKVYSEYKRIGIDLFLNDFGLDGIENKDELKQIDMIVNSLKQIDTKALKNLYIEKYNIIKNNKQKLFDYFCKIMNNVNVFILNDENILFLKQNEKKVLEIKKKETIQKKII
jgi:hypothetical protein